MASGGTTDASGSAVLAPTPALDADVLLNHVRQTVIVVDEVGNIVQHVGSSLGILGYTTDDLVGNNVLEYVAPEHFEAMLFAFVGPEGRIVRSKHLPFKVSLVGRDGRTHSADCFAERVFLDDRYLWVVALTPHELQPASFHAVQAFGTGASSLDVIEAVATSMSMQWDGAFEIRSFVLAGHDGKRFTDVIDQSRHPDLGLREEIVAVLDGDAAWDQPIDDKHTVVSVQDLPAGVASAALAEGFEVADIAIAYHDGEPRLGLLSFGVHKHAFSGNIDMILRDSIHTIEMTLQRERNDDILKRAAEEDPLTGLGNRSRFSDAFGRADSTTAVLFIDLDEFKQINDTFGHATGDAVLIEVARRISLVCRPADVITRFGGDEFAILLAHVDPAGAARISQRVLDAIAEPLPPGIGPHTISASAGLATSGSGATDTMRRADLAMLRGKRAGRGRLVVV